MPLIPREEMDKLIGSPWRLINVADFLVIGLMSLLFMLMLQVLGMGWHRLQILRVTGTAASPAETARSGRGFPSGPLDVASTSIGTEQ